MFKQFKNLGLLKYQVVKVQACPRHIDLLATIASHNYQKYQIDYWLHFMKTEAPKCSSIYIIILKRSDNKMLFHVENIHNNIIYGGILMLVDRTYIDKYKAKHKEIYIRLLCSKYNCGSILLQTANEYATSAKASRISLHTEPQAISFYKKYNYIITKQYDSYYLNFMRYPLMVKYINNNIIDIDIETDKPWLGWGYDLGWL